MKFRTGDFFLVLICVVVLFSTGSKLTQWRSRDAVDFVQFWIVGKGVSNLDALTNVYSRADRTAIREVAFQEAVESGRSSHLMRCLQFRRDLNLAGTPFLYTVFSLISSGDFDRDYEFFRLLSLVAYVGMLIALCLLFGYSWPSLLLVLVGFTWYFWPLKVDIIGGNVNELQLGVVGLFLLFQKKANEPIFGWAGGFLMGLANMFKPNLLFIPMLLMVLWFFQGRKKLLLWHLLGLLMGVAVGYAAPYLILDSKCTWGNWSANFDRISSFRRYINNSFLGMVLNSPSKETNGRFALLLLAFVSGMIALKHFKSQRYRNKWLTPANPLLGPSYFLEDCCITGIAIATYIASGPMVHSHYFLLTVPLILFLLRPSFSGMKIHGFKVPAFTSLAVVVALAFLSMHPIYLKIRATHGWFYNVIWSFLGCIVLWVAGLFNFFSIRDTSVESLLSGRQSKKRDLHAK